MGNKPTPIQSNSAADTSSAIGRTWSRATIVATVVLIVVLLLVALLGLELRRSYSREIQNATRITQSLARVLEQQLLASIEKIDLMAQEAEYQYSAYVDREGLPAEQMAPTLARLLSRIPGVLSLRLVDEGGNYVFDASGKPSSANIADRKYFQVHKAGTAAGLFPEGPLFSRVVNNWTVTFSRGVRDKRGQFRGIVQSSIQSDGLTAAFQGISIGTSDSVTLLNQDMVLVARMPQTPDKIGKPMSESLLGKLIATDP